MVDKTGDKTTDAPKKAGNPNAVEVGKSTRFGAPGGPDPSAAGRSGRKNTGVRHAVRRVSALGLAGDKWDEDAAVAALEAAKGGAQVTVAELLAIKKIAAAMRGSVAALENVTNDIDGKLVERKIEASVSLADLVNGDIPQDDGLDEL